MRVLNASQERRHKTALGHHPEVAQPQQNKPAQIRATSIKLCPARLDVVLSAITVASSNRVGREDPMVPTDG